MTSRCQREIIVRPQEEEEFIVPVQEEVGDLEDKQDMDAEGAVEEKVVDTGTRPVWEKMEDEVEDVATE